MVLKVALGDVLTIPIDERRACMAQVVGTYKGNSWFFAIFEGTLDRSGLPRPSEVVLLPVRLIGLSFDARVKSGDWTVIGNEPIDPRVPLPAFREMVGDPDRVDVVDYSGTRRRRAGATEVVGLPNRTIVSPIALEKACRAAQGLEPWLPRFDKFRPDEATSTRTMFGEGESPMNS